MIDTHAHIDSQPFFGDLDEVVRRAEENGVENIIIPATEPEDFDRIVKIADNYENIYYAVGIHPHSASKADEKSLEIVEKYAKGRKNVAIGEIGLDYYYDFSPKDVQQEIFRRQLSLAKKLNLPVIVHNRESDDDLLKIIEEEQDGSIRGVLHCFSSSVEMMKKAVEIGFYISFTGNITFKNVKLEDVVRETPLERIMLETDSPYMTPVPYRGKRNEPSYVRLVAEKIAEYKSITFEEVLSMTTRTAKDFFRLACILLLLVTFTGLSYAQDTKKDKNKHYETKATEEEENFNPYHKFIGIEPVFGLNTEVITYYLPNNKNASSTIEGVPFYGGALTYSPIDYLLVEFTYNYTKLSKKEYKGLLGPTSRHFFEISSHVIPNPYSRVNFFLTLGISEYLSYDNIGSLGGRPETKNNNLGINTGLGFFFNIPIKGFALMNVTAEWRLNFLLGQFDGFYTPINTNEIILTKASTYMSMPRLGMVLYPYFLMN